MKHTEESPQNKLKAGRNLLLNRFGNDGRLLRFTSKDIGLFHIIVEQNHIIERYFHLRVQEEPAPTISVFGEDFLQEC